MESTKVKTFTDPALKALNDLFTDELQELHCVENMLVKALPKLVNMVHAPEFRALIENHIRDTANYVTRMGNVFESIGVKTAARNCEGMAGLVTDGMAVINRTEAGSNVRDAAIMSVVQKIERYQIASYETLLIWANHLEHHEAIDLLTATLQDGMNTDVELTRFIQRGI